MQDISSAHVLRSAKDILMRRPWFLISVPIVVYLLANIVSSILFPTAENDPALLLLVGFIGSIGISTLVSMGATAFYLKAYDDPASVSVETFWHPEGFVRFLSAYVLTGLLIMGGFILLIIPGIIISIALMFVPYLVIERKLGPVEAIKESARMTRGHRWQLFVLSLVFLLVNLLGLLCLIVGIFFTASLTMLAIVHLYRTLGQEASAMVPAN